MEYCIECDCWCDLKGMELVDEGDYINDALYVCKKCLQDGFCTECLQSAKDCFCIEDLIRCVHCNAFSARILCNECRNKEY